MLICCDAPCFCWSNTFLLGAAVTLPPSLSVSLPPPSLPVGLCVPPVMFDAPFRFLALFLGSKAQAYGGRQSRFRSD